MIAGISSIRIGISPNSAFVKLTRSKVLPPDFTFGGIEQNGEFYLSELMAKISAYYKEKLALVKTEFFVDKYGGCLIKGDLDRSVVVLQNLIENAQILTFHRSTFPYTSSAAQYPAVL